MSPYNAPRIPISAQIADEAHCIIDLARGSLSGDPYDATATEAYGRIIGAIREPWGLRAQGDPEIKFGVGLGRHIAAEASLVYAAAKVIAADRHMSMVQALQVLDAAIDDMAAGRPVTPKPGRGDAPHGRRSRDDRGMPAGGRGRGGQGLSTNDRQHGSQRTRIFSSH